jgi:hypothetical protein
MSALAERTSQYEVSSVMKWLPLKPTTRAPERSLSETFVIPRAFLALCPN